MSSILDKIPTVRDSIPFKYIVLNSHIDALYSKMDIRQLCLAFYERRPILWPINQCTAHS